MDTINYRLVENFPKCNTIIESYIKTKDSNNHHCTSGVFGAQSNLMQKFHIKKCNAAVNFASKINENSNKISRDSLCFYLYFWIYNELKSIGLSGEINAVYRDLFSIETPGKNVCNVRKYSTIINDQENNILQSMYDIYKGIDTVKEYCDYINDDKLCNAINVILHKNSTPKETEVCESCETIISHPCQNNRSFPIIITVIVILLVFLFIFIKFTPYRTNITRRIKRILNIRNHINEEWNNMQSSEIPVNILSDMGYNMSYSCD
ncbi:variable surface protein [Plasmodium gonderi]|uniref:Variable surface protein n=1 Tax=Plasmodium gonderi TaxID=77519 RepID=A0A1Y1JTG3_PLAGO|nr:variable surface protein [Plasmodium gonderi]GAW84052.1 variable surface protein [Plasmodium gonderi]